MEKEILGEALIKLEELLEDEDANVKLKAIELCLKYLASKGNVQVMDVLDEGEGDGDGEKVS